MKIIRRLSLLALAMLAVAALVLFAACDKGDTAEQRVLDHIELNTSNVKTAFYIGDTFTYQGLEVKAHYADETSAVVTGYTVTANNLEGGKLTAQSDKATVSYTEEGVTKTAAYSITVTADPTDGDGDSGTQTPENAVKSIEITKLPTTTVYYVGDTFSAAGLELEVTYEDGTKETVTSGFIASASTAMANDSITVTVSYGGKSDTFTISVYNKLTGLLVDGTSRYAVGADFEGVTVTALYNGKTAVSKVLEEGDYELDIEPALVDGAFAATGKYTVTVDYSENKIDNLTVSEIFTITVTDPDDPNLIAWGQEGHSDGSWRYWANNEDDPGDGIIIEDAEVRFINGSEGFNINATFYSTGSLDWGFQLFYNDTANYLKGGRYSLTLSIVSQTDCAVVINGQRNELKANQSKDIEVEFTYSYNGNPDGMSLFDMQVIVVAGESYDLTLTGIQWEEVDPDTSGGGSGDTDGIVYDVYNPFLDPNIISVWFRTDGYEQGDMYEVELLIDGDVFGKPYEVQANNVAGQYKVMFNNIYSLSGSEEGTAYTVQFRFEGTVYNPVTGVAGGPRTEGNTTYDFTAVDGKLVLTVTVNGSTGGGNTGDGDNSGNTGGGEVGGEGYVVQLSKINPYGNMYVSLYMSSADFALLSGAAKVVVNGSYTGNNWTGGFEVVGTSYINVRLLEAGTAAGDYTLTWYDSDNNLIATCSFTI